MFDIFSYLTVHSTPELFCLSPYTHTSVVLISSPFCTPRTLVTVILFSTAVRSTFYSTYEKDYAVLSFWFGLFYLR